MYKNKYISELPINEVKEYFDELRCNTPWTAKQYADVKMCKERLVVYACKTLEQTNLLDKIMAEIEEVQTYDGIYIDRAYVLEIIDKYRKESEGKK